MTLSLRSPTGCETQLTASPRRRASFVAAAALMLVLWGWSLVPAVENWGNPNEDGFSYVPLFYTTIACLPTALYLLVGAIVGRGRSAERACKAFIIAAGMSLLVGTFLIVQYIANSNHGKVFGIQIGLQPDLLDGGAV